MYPKEVEKMGERVYECFAEDLIEEYKDRTSTWLKETAMKPINDFLLKKFLKDSDLYFKDEEEAIQLTKEIYVHVSIESLRLRGLIDTIEDEKGETVIFLTEKGKEQRNNLYQGGKICKIEFL